MKVELLYITPDAEKLLERIGRICYKSEDKITNDSYKRFIKKLIEKGHESILEHAVASFKISNVSRALTHQLVRHRLASYAQVSQRYVEVNFRDYVVPPDLFKDENKEAYKIYKDFLDSSFLVYYKLLELGIKKEDARYVLPQAVFTEIVVTANFREWRHILKLRLHKSAQWEIRNLMHQICIILYEHAPTVFEDIHNFYKKE